MPFVKLDCGILTSTIWDDSDARIIFITSLLMAEPREYAEPVPQYEVRTISLTGWEAPPDWYGYVPAAGVGIIRNAGVEREAGLAALERLGAADKESRSSDYEGRRLIRIDGGYLVLNFQRYRDRDYTAAERSKRYRDRQALIRGSVVTRDDRNVTRDDTPPLHHKTQAEVEEEEDSEEEVKEESKKESKALSIFGEELPPENAIPAGLLAGAEIWNARAPTWGKSKVLPKTVAKLGKKFSALAKSMTHTYPEWTFESAVSRAFDSLPGLKSATWFTFEGFFFTHDFHAKNQRLWTGFYDSLHGEGVVNGRSNRSGASASPAPSRMPTADEFRERARRNHERSTGAGELHRMPEPPS
jgi:hypothetical protein